MMPTPLASDKHRMIIVTDNPTTRYDYDHLLRSNGQASPWPAFGLADPDSSERRNPEGEQTLFHLHRVERRRLKKHLPEADHEQRGLN